MTASPYASILFLNSKLAKLFLSVNVTYIPRTKNKKADQLGRTRMLLDMPVNAYNEAVKNKDRLKELEKKIKQIKAVFSECLL